MNSPAHTPGPWKVAEDSYGGFNRIWSPDGDDIATCQGDGSIPRETRIANERLIAICPEMAESLRRYRQIHDDGRSLPKKPNGQCDCAECARSLAILQKAGLL